MLAAVVAVCVYVVPNVPTVQLARLFWTAHFDLDTEENQVHSDLKDLENQASMQNHVYSDLNNLENKSP